MSRIEYKLEMAIDLLRQVFAEMTKEVIEKEKQKNPKRTGKFWFASDDERKNYAVQCVELHDNGLSTSAIAEMMPFSAGTVCRLIREYYNRTPDRGK